MQTESIYLLNKIWEKNELSTVHLSREKNCTLRNMYILLFKLLFKIYIGPVKQ